MEENLDYIIENFRLENYLGFAINRSAIIMRRNLASLFREAGYDITAEEFALLSILWDKDVIYQTELNERTLKDKTIITRLLAKLSNKGIIEKKIDETDRRNYQIILTEKGTVLKSDIIPIVLSVIKQATNDISESELEITMKTLGKVFNNLNVDINAIDEDNSKA